MTTATSRALALAVSLALPLAARAAPGRWQELWAHPISHKATVAAFTDAEHGATAGYAGAMYTTSDGGKTWSPALNSSACRFGLELLGDGSGWTSGNRGHVRATADGGAHWEAVADFGRGEPRHARHLSFLDARRGLIASQEEAALTADGGRTWAPLALGRDVGMIAAASLAEEGGRLVVRLLDEDGKLWASADQGKTWKAAPSPLRSPVMESLTGPRAALRFGPAGQGVLVALAAEGEGAVRARAYRTRDGGGTWQEEALPEAFLLGSLTLSQDGRLLASCDAREIRLYRAD